MAENLFAGDCIRTRSGQYVNVFDPRPATITIEDIAHGLSMQCRFGGHLPVFYTVAQHSYTCAQKASPRNALAALMHDASEAYLLDIPSPIKRHLTNYKEIEDGLMQVIAQKFGFPYPLPAEVHQLDREQLEREWHGLMLSETITVHNRTLARASFLSIFHTLNALRA